MLLHHHVWQAMATRFEVFLEGEDLEHLEAVAAAIEDEVRRIESMLSRHDPASEITRIHREGHPGPVKVSVEVADLLADCEAFRIRTRGAFDITAGTGGYHCDRDVRTVHLSHPGTLLDLGGIGKGYALDGAAELARRFGVGNGLLHGGTSSVLALGPPRDGTGWPIDVRDPRGDEHPAVARLLLAQEGFSCSATRNRDQTHSDLIDPATGQPLAGDAACVVVAPTATEAEVLSTALLVFGRASAARYLEEEHGPGIRVAWIEHGHCHWLTEAP